MQPAFLSGMLFYCDSGLFLKPNIIFSFCSARQDDGLLNYLDLYFCHAGFHKIKVPGSLLREVDAALRALRQAVVDPDNNRRIVFEVSDFYHGAKRQCFVSGSEAIVAEALTGAGFAPVEFRSIKAGQAFLWLMRCLERTQGDDCANE